MRSLLKAVLLTACLAFVLGLESQAQTVEADIIYFHRQKKKEEKIKASIVEESPAEVSHRVSGRVEKIPASDIVEIIYRPNSALARADYLKAQRLEDDIERTTDGEGAKKAIMQAMEAYQALLPKLEDAQLARRHIAYKLARLSARLADEEPAQRKPAIEGLSKFLKEHEGGWQVSSASKLLAQLQLDSDDLVGAQKTIESLASRPDLPREARLENHLLLVRSLMANEKYTEAQKHLKSLQTVVSAEDKTGSLRVTIYSANCQGMLDKLSADEEKQLKAITDEDVAPGLKALACNALGDCYRKAGNPTEAFWRYLMVDALYNQDADEHARALFHLSHLFDKTKNDPARAQYCRERLLKDKQFAGLAYRRLALKEK